MLKIVKDKLITCHITGNEDSFLQKIYISYSLFLIAHSIYVVTLSFISIGMFVIFSHVKLNILNMKKSREFFTNVFQKRRIEL